MWTREGYDSNAELLDHVLMAQWYVQHQHRQPRTRRRFHSIMNSYTGYGFVTVNDIFLTLTFCSSPIKSTHMQALAIDDRTQSPLHGTLFKLSSTTWFGFGYRSVVYTAYAKICELHFQFLKINREHLAHLAQTICVCVGSKWTMHQAIYDGYDSMIALCGSSSVPTHWCTEEF